MSGRSHRAGQRASEVFRDTLGRQRGAMPLRDVSSIPVCFLLTISLLSAHPLRAGARDAGHGPRGHVASSAPVTLPDTAAVETASTPQVLKDDLGRPFPLPAERPRRIVSMAPNITEILFALGLGGRVVGVTRFCDWPPEAKAIPKIGGLVDPNVEIIRSLDPDLVIAFRGNPLRLVDRVRKFGLPVFVLDIGEGLDNLFPLIERIGRVTRTEEAAEDLVAGLRARVEAVDAGLRDLLKRPQVFVLLFGQGLWTCGGESYVDDLIARAGGTNVASSLPKKWVLYKRERIIKDDPDVVFILARSPSDFASGRDRFSRMPGMDGIKAVKEGRVYELDENAASRFGPRLVEILAGMAERLHPERFGGGG